VKWPIIKKINVCYYPCGSESKCKQTYIKVRFCTKMIFEDYIFMTELFSLYNKVKRLIDFQEMDIEKNRLFALYEMSLE